MQEMTPGRYWSTPERDLYEMEKRYGEFLGEGGRIWGDKPTTRTEFRWTPNRTDQPYHFQPAISTEWRGTPNQVNWSYHRPLVSIDLRGHLNRTAQSYLQATIAAPKTAPTQKAKPLKYPVEMHRLEYTGEAFKVSPDFMRDFRFRVEQGDKTGDNKIHLITMNSAPLDHVAIFRSNPRNGAYLIEEEFSQRGFGAENEGESQQLLRGGCTCLHHLPWRKPSWSDIGKTKCGYYYEL